MTPALLLCAVVNVSPSGDRGAECELSAVFSPAQTIAAASGIILAAKRCGVGEEVAPGGALRVQASSGDLVLVEPGRFAVTLPANKAPRVVAVALVERVAREGGVRDLAGAAFLPVVGQTELPVTTERAAEVSVRVGETTFGPVATVNNRVVVPIAVPVGILVATVMVRDRVGNERVTTVDLGVPRLPRLAMAAPFDQLGPGDTMSLVLALGTATGAPETEEAPIVMAATHGQVGPAERRGDGLWLATYTAPLSPGEDRITARVEGAVDAGIGELSVLVVPGLPRTISIDIPAGPFGPGEEVAGSLSVRDENDNSVFRVAPSLIFAASPVTLHRGENGYRFAIEMPGAIPATLRLTASAGSARAEVTLAMRPDPAAHDGLETVIQFDPLPPGLSIGIYASAGVATNGGFVTGPRLALGGGVMRAFGPIELGLTLGAELLYAHGSEMITINAVAYEVTRDLTAVAVPLMARIRIGLFWRLGTTLGVAFVPTIVNFSQGATGQPTEDSTEFVPGMRGQAGLDLNLGPGRLTLAAQIGHAELTAEATRGSLERLSVVVGYEWWPVETGI